MLRNVIVTAVVIAAIATAIGLIGNAVVAYWPIVLLILAAAIGGLIYLKRRRHTQNLV